MSAVINPQAYTYPSVTIQSCLTFTAKRWGQFPTITFQNGGTAGSEVVTMDSSFNITIKIQNGVSTATQIAAALNAATASNGLGAGDVCSAAVVGGHASDTPTTYVGVALSGGVAAAKASLTFGLLLVTAKSAGTAGNSIRLKLTSGATVGSEVVTVSTNDISIQIADGVSSWGQILDALLASGAATALVDVASAGRALYASTSYTALDSPTPNGKRAARVSDWSSFTALSGGVAAAAATTGAVNGLTVAANATGTTANGVVVNLTPGGTAGSEVVTDNPDGSFSVQIQSGTSTPTQVAAALNADTAFAALYTATHPGSSAMKTVYQTALTGAVGPNVNGWYSDNSGTALTSSFVYFPFGSMAELFHVQNDETSGAKTIIGSWDGVNNHFIIAATEARDIQSANKPGVYLKYGTNAPAYKAWTVNR